MSKNLKISRNFALAVLLGICGAGTMSRLAGQGATATILGTVTDTSGAAIPEANVQVQNVGTGISESTVSDGQGRFRVPDLGVGDYQVQASKMGFSTVVHTGITLTVGAQSVVDLALPIGQQQQTVTVEGQVAQVETTNGAVGNLIDQTQMHELPLNGRNFEQLIQLAPGVQTVTTASNAIALQGRANLYSVAGSRPSGQAILIDDENMNGFANRGMGSASGTSLGVEGIGEFQMLTNSYGAQFGGNGAVINAVSKSGSNAFHGSAFEFLRNDVMDADSFFHAVTGIKQPLHKNQFGGSLGGPIKKDKVFFFGTYEGIQQHLGETMVALVPACNLPNVCTPSASLPAATKAAIINTLALYPLPNPGTVGANNIGTSVQTAVQPSNDNYFLGRFDYNLSDKDSFFGRYISDKVDYSEPFGGGPIPLWEEFDHSHNQFLTIEERRIITPTIVNVARASFSRQTLNAAEPNQSTVNGTHPLQYFPGESGLQDGAITITSLSALGESPSLPANNEQNRFTEADDILWTKGAHTLRFGMSVARAQTNNFVAPKESPAWSFTGGLSQFLTGVAAAVSGIDYFSGQPTYANRDIREIEYTPYFQDDWKLTPKLTLNLGIRWEMMSDPVALHNTLYAITDFATATSFTNVLHPFSSNPSWHNIDPRFGFAYDPFADHKTSIRGGFGIFHELIVAGEYITGFHNAPPWPQYQQTAPSYPNAFVGTSTPVLSESPGYAWQTNTTPYMIQYNLTLQREIAQGTVLMIGYIGSHGVHLFSGIEDNPYPATVDSSGVYHFGLNPACPTVGRMNCALGTFPDNTPISASRYNAAQVTLNRRFSRSVQAQVAYVFSNCIDDGELENQGPGNGGTGPENPYDQAVDKARCAFDIRQNLKVNALWALPFHGNRLVEGWQISAIESVYSGLPFNITTGVARAFTGSTDRPNYVLGCNLQEGNVNQWYNPQCLRRQAAGTFGNLGRDAGNGPNLVDTDLAVLKDTKLREMMNLQFRAEFFNIFNRANFGLPAATVFSSAAGVYNSQAGKITSIVGTPRQIQLALKLTF